MDFERVCYGCFREKTGELCPYCGYNAKTAEKPLLALPSGTILAGKYLSGKILGVGGFGITYLGYDMTLDTKVAIKEYMPSSIASRGADGYTVTVHSTNVEGDYRSGAERFLDEARILAKLQQVPNIVTVQNFFKENNTAYFVMDYVDGLSLKAFVAEQGGLISFEQAKTILLPVMEALIGVHEKGLLHRDISPDNIYITGEGRSKLLDFGAARFSIGAQKSMSVILKHGFAPEEQYSAHGKQGPWTDVYAMGATIYNCITGTLPPDAIDRLRDDAIMPPSAFGAVMPAYAEPVLLKALAARAEDRYQSMNEFISALVGDPVKTVAATVGLDTGTTVGVSGGGGNTAATTQDNAPKDMGGPLALLKTTKGKIALVAAIAVVALAIVLPNALKKDNPALGEGGGTAAAEPASEPVLELAPEPTPEPEDDFAAAIKPAIEAREDFSLTVDDGNALFQEMQVKSILVFADGTGGLELSGELANAYGDKVKICDHALAGNVFAYGNGGWRVIIFLLEDGSLTIINPTRLYSGELQVVEQFGGLKRVVAIDEVNDSYATTIVATDFDGNTYLLDNLLNELS